jgi:hypothetical protein
MASSEASLAMGLYYVMAAVLNVRAFIVWSIPVRCLNFAVFTVMAMTGIAPARWMMVASLEGIGALVTGLSLLRTQAGRFDSFSAVRIVTVIVAFLGALLAFAPFGIYGSASAFLVIFSAGFVYSELKTNRQVQNEQFQQG